MSERLLALFPPSRREWGEAYLSEFGSGPGLLKVLAYAWYYSTKEGSIMNTIVATASAINLAFGLMLIGLFIFTEGNAAIVLILGLCIVAQGAFTLLYMSGVLTSFEPWATRCLLAGLTVAFLVGIAAGGIAVIETLRPTEFPDPEYGRVMAAGLIAFHAAVALYFYGVKGGAVRIEVPNRS